MACMLCSRHSCIVPILSLSLSLSCVLTGTSHWLICSGYFAHSSSEAAARGFE